MIFRLPDVVAQNRDLPSHSLKCGYSGAFVDVFEPDALEFSS